MERSVRRQLRPASMETYRDLWKRVSRDLDANRPLISIRARELQRWLDGMRGVRAPGYIRMCRGFVAMLFNAAFQAELFGGVNPIRRTEPIRREAPAPRRRLSDWEVARLFRVLRRDRSPGGRLWNAVFGVMLVTGLRIRETVMLQWEDFMWSKGLLRPTHQKRSTAQDILPITPELEWILTTWDGRAGRTGRVFPQSFRSTPKVFCGSAGYYLKKAAVRAGIVEPHTITTHSLRRTFITMAADASEGDHLSLMEVARHRSLAMTRLYMPTISKAVHRVSLATAGMAGRAMGLRPGGAIRRGGPAAGDGGSGPGMHPTAL